MFIKSLDNYIQNLNWQYGDNDCTTDVLRLDAVDKEVSGNKLFKLKYYLKEAVNLGAKRIITYGGVWSNHIAATAAACNILELPCTLIVRSDETTITPTLIAALGNKADIEFCDRKRYKTAKHKMGLAEDGNYYIPEGGNGQLGIDGASTILAFEGAAKYTHIITSIGTGTTFAGLVQQASSTQHIIGVSAVKENQVYSSIKELASTHNATIIYGYDFGGFAQRNMALINFMNDFYKQHHIPTDLVYTGKLFFAVIQLLINNFFPSNSKLLIIHTGGLQGNASLTYDILDFR